MMIDDCTLESFDGVPTDGADQTYALMVAGNIDSKRWDRFVVTWDAIADTLIQHPEDISKEGTAYVPGTLVGTERKKGAVSELSLLVIDCDRGDNLRAIADKLEELGIDSVVHSSYSHLSTTTKIRYDDFLRYSCGASVTPKTAQDYLIEKKGLRREVVGDVSILNELHQTSQGIFIEVEHTPIQKGRIVVRLKDAFNIAKIMRQFGLTQRQVQELWARYIDAFAKLVGVECDQSCKDVSRAFYWSRHPAGIEHFSARIQGEPFDLTTLDTEPSASSTKDGKQSSGDFEYDADNFKQFVAKHSKQFELADAIGAECPERIRGQTTTVTGVVVECPFADFHSNAEEENDKACFVMNSSRSDHGRCVWKCHHASCQSRSVSDFLSKAVADNWFDERALYNPDYHRTIADPCRQARDSVVLLGLDATIEAKNAVFTYLAGCADTLVHAEVLKEFKVRTKMSLSDGRSILKQRQQTAKSEARKSSGKAHFVYQTDPFDDITLGCASLLVQDNSETPHLFRMSSTLIRLCEDEATGTVLSEPITKAVLRQELNGLATFERLENGIGKSIGCPSDISEHLLNDPDLALPPLTTIVDAPFFDVAGQLILEPGYHAPSFTYHHPRRGLELKAVSPDPTKQEIATALDLLMNEVDGDFPFSDGSSQNRSSRAHALALKVEPFVRKMIPGQTPIYVIQKPTPGTGATLFVNALAQNRIRRSGNSPG